MVTQALEKFAEQFSPSVSIAVLDRAGAIVAVNPAWKEFAHRNGLRLSRYGIGANYLEYCTCEPTGLQSELRDLLSGKSSLLLKIYPCNSPAVRRWFFMIGLPFGGNTQSGIALMHVEITSVLPADGPLDAGAIAGSVEKTSVLALSQQVMSLLSDVTPAAAQLKTSEAAERNIEEVRDLAGLSKRQLEILGLIAQGKSNAQIAKDLSRSPNTIREHVSAILRQLNLKSRTQAAVLASKHLKQHFDIQPKPVVGPNRARTTG